MTSRRPPSPRKATRCAIYTRVSTDAGLEQDFNSLDAQREASEAYIKSQAHEGWLLIKTAYDDGGFSGGNLERPALKKLLDDVRASRVDVIVVYKVDRLTRSLNDFAKLVEILDAHRVSFVSVTQSFNTTTSMGRLTLNMLLSFAQFEREVTSERIRDKIAASKKKGIWMGGTVPLGYRVESRKLVIEPHEATTVRMIFERYLALGSLSKLMEELNTKKVVTRRRTMSDGRIVGGVPLTRAPLASLLKNRMYIGEINHSSQSYPGEHPALIERSMFDAVQKRLADNTAAQTATRTASKALLAGLLFDDRGNRMMPSHATKRGVRYRYYVSRALIDGRKDQAGAVTRVSAEQIEATVIDAVKEIPDGAVRNQRGDAPSNAAVAAGGLRGRVGRVVVERCALVVTLVPELAEVHSLTAIRVPWSPRPGRAKREIIAANPSRPGDTRPIRPETRTTLLHAIAKGRQWLQELVTGTTPDSDAIAAREQRSKRSVHMMISLAVLAPDIVEAAVESRLPRGIGVTRLIDLPPHWARQRKMLGLPSIR